MVGCELINIGNIKNEERVKIINYVMEAKGVRARDLGVTINLISMVRSGRRRVTEDLLCRALRFLSTEELARLLGQVPELEPASVNDIVRVVARARADANFRELLLSYLDRYLGEYVRSMGTRWVVTEQDVEEFVKAKRLKGLSEKTIRDEVRYIRLALSELNWVLEPDGIREYLAELVNDGERYVARHVAVSLKSLLKQYLNQGTQHSTGYSTNPSQCTSPRLIIVLSYPAWSSLGQFGNNYRVLKPSFTSLYWLSVVLGQASHS